LHGCIGEIPLRQDGQSVTLRTRHPSGQHQRDADQDRRGEQRGDPEQLQAPTVAWVHHSASGSFFRCITKKITSAASAKVNHWNAYARCRAGGITSGVHWRTYGLAGSASSSNTRGYTCRCRSAAIASMSMYVSIFGQLASWFSGLPPSFSPGAGGGAYRPLSATSCCGSGGKSGSDSRTPCRGRNPRSTSSTRSRLPGVNGTKTSTPSCPAFMRLSSRYARCTAKVPRSRTCGYTSAGGM